ncbi:unnamed protein product [Cylindrotheca closterium]|uniref:Uncharacterized protein n=1 Tax=Cylindrotheca closterium TaxID=2856 RepID=A0AAD2CWD2_9STRA|nr:unnamed protein product [Cylindrotheca closterium]
MVWVARLGGETASKVINTVLAFAQRAIGATVNKSLVASPGAIFFHRDMLLNVPAIVDLEQASGQCQAVADCNNLTKNKHRRYKNYNIGDLDLDKDDDVFVVLEGDTIVHELKGAMQIRTHQGTTTTFPAQTTDDPGNERQS